MIIFEEKKSVYSEKYVFLDFDGVISGYPHPINKSDFDKDKRYFQLFNVGTNVVKDSVSAPVRKDLLQNLKNLLHKSRAKLIISSSWRNHPDTTWRDKLEEVLNYYIFDITPTEEESGISDSDSRFTNCPRVFCRAYQIDFYCKKHKVKNYVVLDDLPLHEYKTEFPDLFKHFICTNNDNIPGNYGLTEFKAKKALEMLEGKRVNIKYNTLPIDFPKEEINKLKKQKSIGTFVNDKNMQFSYDIVTTRVDKDYNLYYIFDMVKAPWNECYTVMHRIELDDIEDHPFYDKLTKSQIKLISKYDKYAVLFLKKSK